MVVAAQQCETRTSPIASAICRQDAAIAQRSVLFGGAGDLSAGAITGCTGVSIIQLAHVQQTWIKASISVWVCVECCAARLIQLIYVRV